MITLYHCVAARSFRPLWALEELELVYELKMLPFPPRALERWFLGRLRTLEPVLEGRTALCGERFTMADVSVGYALLLAEYLGLAGEFAPALARYLAGLKERPAFRRAQAAEEAAARGQGVSAQPAPLTLP